MLARFLGPWTEGAYALLRIASGLMLAFHGVQLVFGYLVPERPAVGSQAWIGGLLQLGCGLLIAAGAATVWAAFLASGEMAVAYVQFHWKLQGGAEFFPAVNKGELALLYALLFLFIACRGAGRWSVDGRAADRT